MNIVDLIIVVFILLGAAGGYSKGFVASLVGLFSRIIGLIAAFSYYPLAAKWLDAEFGLKEYISEFLQAQLQLPQPVAEFRLGKLPLLDASNYLDSISMPEPLKTQLLVYLDRLEGITSPLQFSLGEIINQYLASALISGLAFLLIWFGVDLLLRILAKLFSGAIKNTAFGFFDRLAGLVMGAALTALVLTVCIGLITPVLQLADISKPTVFSAVMKTMGESWLVPGFSSCYDFLFSQFMSLLPL